jgi:biopolymer transport protein ExbD
MIRIVRGSRRKPEIGLAPLVDCVFQLLLFFILASNFSRTGSLRIELPGSRSASPEERKVIRVAVAESGEVTVESRPVAPSELASALAALVRERGRVPLLLLADRRSRLEAVTGVIDGAREAGVEKISIATRVEASKTLHGEARHE